MSGSNQSNLSGFYCVLSPLTRPFVLAPLSSSRWTLGECWCWNIFYLSPAIQWTMPCNNNIVKFYSNIFLLNLLRLRFFLFYSLDASISFKRTRRLEWMVCGWKSMVYWNCKWILLWFFAFRCSCLIDKVPMGVRFFRCGTRPATFHCIASTLCGATVDTDGEIMVKFTIKFYCSTIIINNNRATAVVNTW